MSYTLNLRHWLPQDFSRLRHFFMPDRLAIDNFVEHGNQLWLQLQGALHNP
ncbi:hypothetical protein SAMN05421870_118112 [Streptomyces qinglanensis]|uniref:Uncharacterized protein n=1 Tax=Streptomyces qinglanensis TaxID=943816 RepID=A0A1H9WKJ1_9ACTN|nr:hypothetical protein SAMN05421870_118112 [Streptomyces qinglanensis]